MVQRWFVAAELLRAFLARILDLVSVPVHLHPRRPLSKLITNPFFSLPFHLQWTWTAQVFLVLHTITLLMKMHSYAFYNGHLSECELELEMLDILQKGTPSSGTDTPTGADTPTGSDTPTSDSADDGGTVDRPMLYHRRKVLADELTSPLGNVTYPNNVTFLNYIDFVCCPTLCYEIEYPRVPEIRWHKLAQDTLAVFGCVGLMILISGEFIFPVLHESSAKLGAADTTIHKAIVLAETVSMMLTPFLVCFLLNFLVIFEYILGASAEVTRFADRSFYLDWWNSRDWYVPVHRFSVISAFPYRSAADLTRPSGSNSLVNGTCPSTISSGDMYTSPP